MRSLVYIQLDHPRFDDVKTLLFCCKPGNNGTKGGESCESLLFGRIVWDGVDTKWFV